MDKIEIVEYEDKYSEAIKEISLEWLHKFNLLEDVDFIMLNDPTGQVVDKGGHVYMALLEGIPAGTVSLEKTKGNAYEILKFGVSEKFRGAGIGSALMAKVIEVSRAEGMDKIILCTNHKLTQAIELYKKFGFTFIPYDKTKFDMSDMKMELNLNE